MCLPLDSEERRRWILDLQSTTKRKITKALLLLQKKPRGKKGGKRGQGSQKYPQIEAGKVGAWECFTSVNVIVPLL